MQEDVHVLNAIASLNNLRPSDALLSAERLDAANARQRALSTTIEDYQREGLLDRATTASRARLRAVAQPHAGSWLQVVPSTEMGLALSNPEFSAALALRLGTSGGRGKCPLCGYPLGLEGAHALQCRSGGDTVFRHNALRDCLSACCTSAASFPRVS